MNEFWINPLGLKDDAKITTVDGATDYTAIVLNLNVALKQIEDIKNLLINECYVDPDSLKSQSNKFIKVDQYKNVNIGFNEMYHTLQKFGAVLYHIIRKADNSEYEEKLNDTKENMIEILCEIQKAVLISNQIPYRDYKYEELLEIIGEKKLVVSEDFLIMRDYGKFVEILLNMDVFKPRVKVQKKKKNGKNIPHCKKAKH